MALDEEENAWPFVNFSDGFLEECLDVEKSNNLVDFDDSKSVKGCEDIADLLPYDPFDMDFNVDFNLSLPRDPFGMDFDVEATVEAITEWIEDFGLQAYGFETDEAAEDEVDGNNDNRIKAAGDNCYGDNKFFAELNFVWTGSMEFEQEDWESEIVDGDSMSNMEEEDRSHIVEDLMCFGCEKYEIEAVKDDSSGDGDGGDAADIIIFVLGYLNLGFKDLLSVERVCKTLRDAVQKDPYLWTKIHIGYPLSLKICNDDLLRLTDRAQGKLRSLGLEKCLKITNDGLKQVLDRNMELTKLSVAGSIKLGFKGVLNNLKVFNSVAVPGIKRLRIGESIDITNEHLKEFKVLLGAHEGENCSNYKPRYFRAGEIYLSLDDERAIDIETCPRCQNLGQVYDCPTEDCRVTAHSTKPCRACINCIARCIRCGCCLDNKAYEETFCFDFLCFDCLGELFNLDGVRFSAGQQPYFHHQMASYHFFLYS